MAFLTGLVRFSLVLKIAWAAWFVAAYALILWRRQARTDAPMRAVIAPPRKAKAESAPAPKRRWRLRANEDAPALHSSSLLGLQ